MTRTTKTAAKTVSRAGGWVATSVRLPATADRGYKVQSFRYGVGPWEDDCAGEWLDPAGVDGRRWQEGLTLAQATERVAASERSRQKPEGFNIPPRRVVPLSHPSGVSE